MKEVTLPSGAILKLNLAPFADAKALYQAVFEEMRGLDIDPDKAEKLLKDLFCVGLSSKKIEKCLQKCLERVLYNGLKITDELFEDEAARGDYIPMCTEVAKENLLPFMKSLFVGFHQVLDQLQKPPA